MSIHQDIKGENITKLNQLLKEIYRFIEALEEQVREDIHCCNQDVEVDAMTTAEGQNSK
ncbi:hypothetical protein H6F77_14320 [Microcoleus sp. FACHB-831]|uniref:hypothetical protein n=1 Tax=Microcoleus sp. FACHB-831 TaxID=2692827 RepID=UPI001682C3D1|nr:hypothetical protein [Microcoleus sp. FACHB-831]MBD1922249.1 hypothetical protein [Microcoleus sp. FACHB-831]